MKLYFDLEVPPELETTYETILGSEHLGGGQFTARNRLRFENIERNGSTFTPQSVAINGSGQSELFYGLTKDYIAPNQMVRRLQYDSGQQVHLIDYRYCLADLITYNKNGNKINLYDATNLENGAINVITRNGVITEDGYKVDVIGNGFVAISFTFEDMSIRSN